MIPQSSKPRFLSNLNDELLHAQKVSFKTNESGKFFISIFSINYMSFKKIYINIKSKHIFSLDFMFLLS